jgi:hypothetical protein
MRRVMPTRPDGNPNRGIVPAGSGNGVKTPGFGPGYRDAVAVSATGMPVAGTASGRPA